MGSGADEEFGEFMRARWPAMVRLAYALSGDAGHAEDIAQAAFARACAAWGRVSLAGSPNFDSGQIATAIPFDPPGRAPSFGRWLKPGQAAG